MVVIGRPNIESDEYIGAADDSIKALVSKAATSLESPIRFSKEVIPSRTISVEASLLNSEIHSGRAVANSSILFIDVSLETFKNLPFRSMPLSAR